MTKYRHRQIGTLVIVLVGSTMILMAFLLMYVEYHPVGTGVLVFLGILLFLFGSLSVDISEESLLVYFGPGLIRKTFNIDDISKAKITRNSWYHGWGVRRVPGCWMFNVSGLDSVEISLKNGKRFRIGTDEPETLLDAIRSAAKLEY